jgi:hypothetical protein
MKFCVNLTFLLFLSTSLSNADVPKDELDAAAIFGRTTRFSNTLCLPLFDNCNRNSQLADCGSLGDPCSDGVSSCAKTTEGGIVCVVDGDDDDETFCISSEDCKRE